METALEIDMHSFLVVYETECLHFHLNDLCRRLFSYNPVSATILQVYVPWLWWVFSSHHACLTLIFLYIFDLANLRVLWNPVVFEHLLFITVPLVIFNFL